MPLGYLQRKGPVVTRRGPWPSSQLLGVSGSKIDDGSITQDKLEPALLQGFHVNLLADATKLGPGHAVPVNITEGLSYLVIEQAPFGLEQWSSQTTLSLGVGCTMRIHAQVQLREDATPMLPGARAMLQMVRADGTVVAAGPWHDATMTSDGVCEIVAVLDDELILQAGADATYSFQYLAQAADGSSVISWSLMEPRLGLSPPHTGTYVEGMPVPQHS